MGRNRLRGHLPGDCRGHVTRAAPIQEDAVALIRLQGSLDVEFGNTVISELDVSSSKQRFSADAVCRKVTAGNR
jgi:hypothetical protein